MLGNLGSLFGGLNNIGKNLPTNINNAKNMGGNVRNKMNSGGGSPFANVHTMPAPVKQATNYASNIKPTVQALLIVVSRFALLYLFIASL